MSMKLAFSKTPVDQTILDKVLKEQEEAAQKRAALTLARDMERCQQVVDRGLKHLKQFRDFQKAFKQLQSDAALANPKQFQQVLSRIGYSHIFGDLFIEGEYDNDDVEETTVE